MHAAYPSIFNRFFPSSAGRETQIPFDQHFLVAAIAPRYVSAGTAIEDLWADPNKQYLSYVAANDVYKLLGKKEFVHPDRLPEVGDIFHDGDVGFHIRSGTHFHSRYDWLLFMEFMKKHRIEKL